MKCRGLTRLRRGVTRSNFYDCNFDIFKDTFLQIYLHVECQLEI